MTQIAKVPLEFLDVPVEIQPSDKGGYVAFNDRLQIVVHGDTEKAAKAEFVEAVRDLVHFCFARRLPLPDGLTMR